MRYHGKYISPTLLLLIERAVIIVVCNDYLHVSRPQIPSPLIRSPTFSSAHPFDHWLIIVQLYLIKFLRQHLISVTRMLDIYLDAQVDGQLDGQLD